MKQDEQQQLLYRFRQLSVDILPALKDGACRALGQEADLAVPTLCPGGR
ncbi:MAG: hypothetical protein OXC07_13245 [Kistimonas sp.]|nr:hypothetical protein [Kistimonas sp.]